MLAKVVERQDIDVDTARDGQEAIDRIETKTYHVIVLDLMMPKVDGYTVLKYLHANHPELLNCTIIASAVPESEILRRFNMPVFRIHSKPFDMSRLIEDIRHCTGQEGESET